MSRKHHCAHAGTIGQVYEALARELGLPADQKPMELLLLIELQQHQSPVKFTKPEALVSAIKERANLMVYRYASQASGPSIGRAIHLFHRSAGLFAPLFAHNISQCSHLGQFCPSHSDVAWQTWIAGVTG